VVSHDRHFLDQIVNKVWRVEHGQVREYLGNYTEYLWQIEHGTASRVAPREAEPPSSSDANEKKRTGGPKTKEQKRREAEERNSRRQMENGAPRPPLTGQTPAQLRKAHELLERTIERKESELTDIEQALADPSLYDDMERANTVTATYQTLKDELASLYRDWERTTELLAETE
jgi:ATP-binding cassette subfamily F protein 3